MKKGMPMMPLLTNLAAEVHRIPVLRLANPRLCFLHPRRCVNRQIALVVSPRRECVPSGTTIRLPGPMTSGHGGIAAEIRVVRVRSEGQSRIRPTKLRRGLRSAAAPRVSASDPRLPPKGILKAQISYNLAPWDAFTLYAPLANWDPTRYLHAFITRVWRQLVPCMSQVSVYMLELLHGLCDEVAHASSP